ncbi:amidohydrolase family protein [Chloroflexota bacterium]
MKEFDIVDAHTHLFRDSQEESETFPVAGRRPRDRWGTPDQALAHMDRNGISKMCFMGIMPQRYRAALKEKARLRTCAPNSNLEDKVRTASRGIATILRDLNSWACDVGRRYPRLLPFVLMSDDFETEGALVQELSTRLERGAKGVKLQPGMYSFFPDSAAMWPLYERCQDWGVPIVVHSGAYPPSLSLITHPLEFMMNPGAAPSQATGRCYTEPDNWIPVLEAFPRLVLILAHFGSTYWDERVELAQKYQNVHFDTSQGFSAPDRIPVSPHRALAEEDAVRVIRRMGVGRVMFASDGPANDFQPQLEQLLRLGFTDEERRMILAENARRILTL